MKNQEILDQLTYEDLNDDMKYVHDALGMDAVKQLLVHCGGTSLHVPKVGLIRPLVKRYMDGKPNPNVKKIASDLGVSERFIAGL